MNDYCNRLTIVILSPSTFVFSNVTINVHIFQYEKNARNHYCAFMSKFVFKSEVPFFILYSQNPRSVPLNTPWKKVHIFCSIKIYTRFNINGSFSPLFKNTMKKPSIKGFLLLGQQGQVISILKALKSP